jgi:hypothetical protein
VSGSLIDPDNGSEVDGEGGKLVFLVGSLEELKKELGDPSFDEIQGKQAGRVGQSIEYNGFGMTAEPHELEAFMRELTRHQRRLRGFGALPVVRQPRRGGCPPIER